MDIGQGDAPESIESVAQFLTDTSADEPENEETEHVSTESSEDNSDDATEDTGEESDDSEDAESQQGLKFKITVKGEDGSDQTIEVDQKELINGYQRHADYTRKTQELANREREVTQQVVSKLQEGQNYYLQQTQIMQNAVRQLAGLKSPDEMAVLAQTDPAAWVAEQQRERAINGVIGQLQEGVQREQAQRQQIEQQQKAQAFQNAWNVLQREGVDKPTLQKIYSKAAEKYGVTDQELANLYDPKAVLILRDAIAYQELKANKQTVTKKATEAPKLPAQRQTAPKQVQRAQQINKRFSSGKAKLSDLAAYLENS